jgi:hypothetical protein
MNGRNANGQVLAEGAAGLVIFTSIFVGCLMLFINTIILGSYKWKLEAAATEAAKLVDQQKYWLGMQRPDYDYKKATSGARDLADAMLNELGLSSTSSFTVTESQVKIPSLGTTATVTHVKLSVNKIPTVGNCFAPFIELSAEGAACEGAVPAYGTVQLAIIDQALLGTPASKKCRIIQLPAYFVGNGWDGAGAPDGSLQNTFSSSGSADYMMPGNFATPTSTALLQLYCGNGSMGITRNGEPTIPWVGADAYGR